jgi:hypothetical protein
MMAMKTAYKKIGFAGLALTGLLAIGCLVSGTFVIVEDVEFAFTADRGFYWYPIDLTANSDWQEHREDIDNIDAIGFEFTIENTSSEDCVFNAWFVAEDGPAVPANFPLSFVPSTLGATKVINDLSVAAGATRTVGYAESLGHITNLAAFKAIIKSGRFDYYGTSCGGTDDSEFLVTEGKIIITVSASDT